METGAVGCGEHCITTVGKSQAVQARREVVDLEVTMVVKMKLEQHDTREGCERQDRHRRAAPPRSPRHCQRRLCAKRPVPTRSYESSWSKNACSASSSSDSSMASVAGAWIESRSRPLVTCCIV